MFKKFLDKPFRLLSIIECLYLIINILLRLVSDFPFTQSIYPYSRIIALCAEIAVLLLCVLTYFFYNKHWILYAGLELLVFSNLYDGQIYAALFLSSILLVLLLTENPIITHKVIIIYLSIEIIKIAMVVPFGTTQFFYYVGLNLFALCTIGCINLLFRHAYSKSNPQALNLDDFKLSDRQKNCIQEIVVNNTTIKALAITHNVSESAIKKDLAHIYKILGITGKADLKALFIDYKF